jgi:flagellar biosynthesis/type III secretory pathway protein FliH
VLQETISQTRAVIQINPDQINYITREDIIAKLNFPQKGNLRFIPNPQLQPGECKLETEEYLVDGTFTTQLENIRQALLETHATDSE